MKLHYLVGIALPLVIFSSTAFGQDVLPDSMKQRVVACIGCHGNEGRAASDGFYPRIAGKPAGYLLNQLINFREGRRSFPAMTYMTELQSEAFLKEIADYFAAQHPPYPAPQSARVTPAILERGHVLVMSGDQSGKVPACIACHGQALTGLEPAIPGLLGLPQDYLNAQLGAWKSGARHAAAPDCMAQIAERLSAADISATVAWLAAQPAPPNPAAALSTTARLPMACGSMLQSGSDR